MKNLTQLPRSGKCSKAKNDNTLGLMHGGIRSRIGSMSLKNTSLFGVILALLLTLGVGQMWAGKGFWGSGQWNVKYYDGSGSDKWIGEGNDGATKDLGIKTTLYLKGSWVKTWSDGGWTQSSVVWNYGLSSSYGNTKTATKSSVQGDQTWDFSVDYNVIANAPNNPGQNTIYMYWRLDNYVSSTASYINFTIPGFKKTSVSQDFGNVTVSSTKDLTISFTQHYGTALTTSNCALSGTNSSEFEVRSISETGVTVRFKPSSNGSKSATLTITDAHSKTCTITLSGKTQRAVTYKKGDNGTGSDITDYKVYNTNLTLRSSGFTRTGYNLTAWNTSSNGTSGTSYALGATYSSNNALTLYPTWTAKTTTITLNNADATTAGTTEVTATYDATIPTITIPTKTGYTFGGYWGAPSGTGPKYINADGTSNGTWQNEASTYTLYAAWSENKSAVTLVASPTGTGTFQVGGVTVTSTQAGVATTPAVTAVPIAGYSFDGWSISGGASISSTTDNPTTVTGGGAGTAATLTATFVENPTYYLLKFGTRSGETSNGSVAAKDGSNNPLTSNKEYLSGTSVTVTATAADDYKFDSWYHGWSTGSSFSTVNPLTFTLSEATNVYAHFVQKTTSITLNKGIGSGGTAGPVTATHGSATLSTNPLVTPAKSGYTFTGYWTEASGGVKVIDTDGTLVASVSGYTKTGNKKWDYDDPTLTLYAQYSEKMTTVTVNVSPAGAGTLTVGGGAFTPGNTTTAGIATSRTVVATAGSGKVFLDWTITGNATGSASTNTYTLNGDGSGGTGTLTANFGILSGWNMEGEDFGGWSRPSTYKFIQPYRGMSGVYYIQTTLTKDRWWKVNNGTTPFNATNANTTISKGTIYDLVEEWSNSSKVSSTMSNVWVVINTNSTKKIWVQNPQTFHNVNVSNDGSGIKGTYTVTLNSTTAFTKGSNVFETTQFADGEEFKVTVTGESGWIPTITIGGTPTTFWKEADTYEATGTMSTSDIAVNITYTASRALTFSTTTGCATLTATGPGSTSVTSGTKIKDGTSITFAQTASTGYSFSKWYSTSTGEGGTQYSTADSYTLTTSSSANTIYPIYTLDSYTITLDKQTGATGYGSSGTAANPTATYNAVLPAISGTMPAGTGSYGFMGFYTGTLGTGLRLTDASGAWIASVEGYTDADKKWIHAEDVTLYAYYKQAEISEITFESGTTVAQSTSVSVTAVLDPAPAGTTVICWRVLYSNDNPLDPQPAFTPVSGTTVTFTSPEASGSYKVEAKLQSGSSCGGSEIDTKTADFNVAGEHTVTIQYKCGSTVLRESASMTALPLDWSDEIEAPEIFGYTFSGWSAGDGITITGDDGETSGSTSSEEAIKVKATYDGTLTANYTQKSLIYFKNTLGWSSVYVNFYTNNYWGYNDDAEKGTGNSGVTNRNKTMTRIGETDVWYFDYGAASITPSAYVSFTEDIQQDGGGNGYQYFWKSGDGENVVYPTRYPDAKTADKASESGFKPMTPMFVPLASQTAMVMNNSDGGKANYYNYGYWTMYTAGTGYTLEVYNSAGNNLLKTATFASADELMPMRAVVDLEAGATYKFQLRRGGTGSDGAYYGHSGTMTYANHGQSTAWDMTNAPSFSMAGITTNAAGDYTFNLSYSADGSGNYRLRMAVDYPIANGDYRLVYSDNKPSAKPSAIIPLVANGKDTVSFFVRQASSPVLRIEKSTVDGSGNITWANYPTSGTPTNQITGEIASAITENGVYNFCLEMDAEGALTVAKAEKYTGNYYIRTDCANSKWDNYRSDPDHLMIFSAYSKAHAGYSHYYTHWVETNERKNVKFCVANDYSPCISDTLIRETASGTWANIATYIEPNGDLKRNANVRFMWNEADNTVSRAYVDGAQSDGTHFLEILSADSKIKNESGSETLSAVTFRDNGNWIYEANIQAQPNAQIKLKSTWGESNIIEQYFRGTSTTTETLMGGEGSDWYSIRLVYDFKTNRLVTAYIPSGNISKNLEIHADIMFMREHQGDINQITFSEDKSISEIENVYFALKFNKWTLNNRSKTGEHTFLSPLLSRYERDLFYVSFPFDVKVSDIIGFGTYGTHWIIEYYDGAGRAKNGFWADSESYWKFVTPTMKNTYTLKAGTGYIVALDLDELWYLSNESHSSVWDNTDEVELLFPGNVSSISTTSVTYKMPAHKCEIGPRFPGGEDRTIKDSHWNVLGVPTYHNLDAGAGVSAANSAWIADHPKYIYSWNMQDNSLTATSATGFNYKAMHAYVVQYYGDVTFTTSASPAPIIARNAYEDAPEELEFRLALLENDESVDQTFVRLSNDENVSAGFIFGEDISKAFNKDKANIYTFIADVQTAGNILPMSEQTTVVPVGVKIAADGDYTFAIPDGTEGVGVTLIDQETGIRTSLSALAYTVSLEAGTYDERFVLEISPIHNVPTEQSAVRDQQADVRKVLIDGLLYIVRDNKMYDARGAMVMEK